MAGQVKSSTSPTPSDTSKGKVNQRKTEKNGALPKRRCIGSACIACKRRKSKCDGALPSCAACVAVYGTACEYDLASDHRRKGVYKTESNTKTKVNTLQTLIEAILNYPEDEAFDLVQRMRNCSNLDEIAGQVQNRQEQVQDEIKEEDLVVDDSSLANIERDLSTHMGHMRLENGTIHFLGGTSNLRFGDYHDFIGSTADGASDYTQNEDSVRSWTEVTSDVDLILHLLQLYFTWHYPSFTTLSKTLFFRDFFRGRPLGAEQRREYCTPLLVNAMLALGCHFTAWHLARSEPADPATAGNHFFREAKRLIIDNEEFEKPCLATVQALALMSVREAGCAREAKGWVYSGMSFRMACDLGLNIKLTRDHHTSDLNDQDLDARRITFWGCYQFDKCWSNYLGRPPQLAKSNITIPKFDVFPEEEAEIWSPRGDQGVDRSRGQPARTRAVALHMSALCEISEDLLLTFYSPIRNESMANKQAEVKKLSDFHTRLEAWLKELPKEMLAKEGQLPYILVMHMFFQLLYIHLFRPFLKYTKASSPLPADVSPRKLCTQAAAKISKLLRLYKKTYGLKQICNIVVYIIHSACSIHLLNLPDKDATRDLGYGIRHLEEMAESWLCASRTLATLAVQVRRWKIVLPDDISEILAHWNTKYKMDHPSPDVPRDSPAPTSPSETADLSPGPFQATHQVRMQGHLANNGVLDYSLSTIQEAGIQASDLAIPGLYDQLGNVTQVKNSKTKGVRWPSTRPIIPSSQRRTSPATLYGGIDSLFAENRDWWYEDQSTLYEHWSKRDSSLDPSQNFKGMLDVMSMGTDPHSNLMIIDPSLDMTDSLSGFGDVTIDPFGNV